MNLEFISFSDGKEAVAKAANFLFEKHYSSANVEKPDLKESDVAEALMSIGLLFFMFPQICICFSPHCFNRSIQQLGFVMSV